MGAFVQIIQIDVIRAMRIVVLANKSQREALISAGVSADVVWVEQEDDLLHYGEADAFVDLQFVNVDRRCQLLEKLQPRPVIVNSVIDTLDDIGLPFARVNAWTTFLSSPVLEASCQSEATKAKANEAFSAFNKQVEWVPDAPGFVSARVISMIVNEAFLTLAEGVSTKEEINTAMKLGTAYPYGPFEWAEKIGLQSIVALLQKLSISQTRYTPAELLLQEALRS